MFKEEKRHVIAQAVAVLNSRKIQGIFRFGATPTKNSKHREPGGTGRNQETGTEAQKEFGETQSSSRTCCIVQILSFAGFLSF